MEDIHNAERGSTRLRTMARSESDQSLLAFLALDVVHNLGLIHCRCPLEVG